MTLFTFNPQFVFVFFLLIFRDNVHNSYMFLQGPSATLDCGNLNLLYYNRVHSL